MWAVGRDPVAVGFGRIHKMPAATAQAEAWRSHIWTNDCRNSELGTVEYWINKKHQRGGVQRVG